MTAPLFPDLRLATIAGLLREAEAEWRALGVTRLRLFGSVARSEAAENSDIDLLADFGEEVGLLHLMRVKERLEKILERRVDVVQEASLRPPLRGEILADAVDVMNVPPLPPLPTHRPKRWRWRLYDLLATLDRLLALSTELNYATFLMREEVQDAVKLGLLRLGETTKYIPQSVQDRHPELPWAYLRDIRNLVAHDYFGIAPETIWRTLRDELPALRPHLQALADSSEPDKMSQRK